MFRSQIPFCLDCSTNYRSVREVFEQSQSTKIAHLQIRSQDEGLREAFEWFDQLNQPPIIPESIWMMACKTAFHEGLTNAVRHGHKDLSKNTLIDIEVSREIETKRIEIRIWDRGPGFNLQDKLKEMEEKNSPNNFGGRGLLLMRDLGDGLSYTQTSNNQNCLLFVKTY